MTFFPHRRHGSLFALVLLLTALPAAAQNTPVTNGASGTRLTVGGALQARASVNWRTTDEENSDLLYGAGIRRARLQFTADLWDRTQVFMQLAGANGSIGLLDVWAAYRVSPILRVRLGRFASTQPEALIPTGLPHIDAIGRASIAEAWAATTVGSDGRDFGVEAIWQTDEVEASLLLHHGDGTWSAVRGNVQDDITGLAVPGPQPSGIAITSALKYILAPAVDVGGTVGFSTAKPARTADPRFREGRNYITYSAHAYWGNRPGSRPVRAKLDVIGIRFQPVERGDVEVNQHWFGVSLLGAAQAGRGAEVFARVESLDPNAEWLGSDAASVGDGSLFVTGGFVVSPSALRGLPFYRERFTIGYAGRYSRGDGPSIGHHQLVAQLQVVFF